MPGTMVDTRNAKMGEIQSFVRGGYSLIGVT